MFLTVCSRHLRDIYKGTIEMHSISCPLIKDIWYHTKFISSEVQTKHSPWDTMHIHKLQNSARNWHIVSSLRWRRNQHGGVSNHQPHGCLLNRLFRRRSEKTSKLRVTGPLCGEFTGPSEFPTQRASYVENVSIWWRHHLLGDFCNLWICNQIWTKQKWSKWNCE